MKKLYKGGCLMRLLNVRKGQFVYYNNKLHKVYSVKPFLKQSIHLIRLEDLGQQLTTAKEIDLYKPQHLDSFISNHKRYTLHKDAHAQVGDYILVINPRPDSLDHHYLHAIEMVASIEDNGVITNKSNGIKHNEYWVMLPGLQDGANIIDLQKPDPIYEQEVRAAREQHTDQSEIIYPKIGNVYQKLDSDLVIQTMVIAIKDDMVYLGGNIEITIEEMTNTEKWQLMYNISELI